MFTLIPTLDYQKELEEISGGGEELESDLIKSVYFALERNPFVRPELGSTGLRVLRRFAAMGLLCVDVYYRVDVAANTVSLVSIRVIDTTTL